MLALLAARGASAPTGSYRSAVLSEPSVFCYYPLDDAVGSALPVDATGNTTPQQCVGVTFGAAGIGAGATAATFDGGAIGGGIAINESQLITSITAFTVEVLAKPTNTSAQRAIFGRDNYYVWRHTNTGSHVAIIGAPSWPNTVATVTEAAPLAVHHLALTWDGTETRMYRDGAQIATKAASAASISSAGKPLRIGGRATSDTTFLGTLAGFALHYNALSPARILAHAQAAGVA